MGIIANSDSFWGIHASNYLYSSFYSWYDFLFGGLDGSSPLLFGYAIATLLNLLQLSFANTGVVLLVMCGIWYATYKIADLFVHPQTSRQKQLTAAATAFVISNEMMRAFLNTNITILWGTLFMHLSIYWFLRATLQKGKKWLFVSVLFLNCSFIDFHSAVLAGIFICAFAIVSIMGAALQRQWRHALHVGVYLTLFAALAFLLNAYWLLSIIYNEINHVGLLSGYSANTAITSGVLDIYNTYNTLAYNIILSTNNVIRHTWLDIVDVVLTYLLVAVAICSVFLMKRTKNTQLVYLVVLTFCFLSLAFGPLSPLGIFDFFWQHVPGFTLFRNFFKFHRLLLLIYSVLLAFVATYFTSKEISKKILIYLCVVMIMKGSLYVIHAAAFKPFKVPEYYQDFQNSLKNNPEDTHLAVLPMMSAHLWFDWPNAANYDIQDPIRYYPTKPVLLNVATPQEGMPEYLNKQLALSLASSNDRDLFFTIAGIQNIRYVLIRDDLSQAFLASHVAGLPVNREVLNIKGLIYNANSEGRLQKVATYGKLHLYKIKDSFYLPHLYIPIHTQLSEDDMGAFITHSFSELQAAFAGKPKNAAVFYAQQNAGRTIMLSHLEKENTQITHPAQLEYKKINPVKYRLRIRGAHGRFPLVFSESFHQNWLLYQRPYTSHTIEPKDGVYISDTLFNTTQNDTLPTGSLYETWFTSMQKHHVREVARATHSVANISTNAWIIDTDAFCTPSMYCHQNANGTQDMELIIEYFPQRIYVIGLIISGITLFGGAGILLFKPITHFFSTIP